MKKKSAKYQLTVADREALLETLEARFAKNMQRHRGLEWRDVLIRIQARPDKLAVLSEMERTGGEPDVVSVGMLGARGFDTSEETGEFIFVDCAKESPLGRRSVCYDREGLESRKDHPPANNAIDMAAAMGIELLSEVEYRQLQELGCFDTKTSSWLKTPDSIRSLGGALFGDFRYGATFVYHNGAQSYYAARGFRGAVRV